MKLFAALISIYFVLSVEARAAGAAHADQRLERTHSGTHFAPVILDSAIIVGDIFELHAPDFFIPHFPDEMHVSPRPERFWKTGLSPPSKLAI